MLIYTEEVLYISNSHLNSSVRKTKEMKIYTILFDNDVTIYIYFLLIWVIQRLEKSKIKSCDLTNY